MSLYLKRLPAFALALTLGLAGCGDSPLSPEEVLDNFDAENTQANLEAVDNAFDTPVLQSLSVLGENFGLPGAAPAGAMSLISEAADLSSASLSHRIARAAGRVAETFEAANAAVVLIPEQYRGLVFKYDLVEQGYVLDESQTGPTNGVRFLLYAINPVTMRVAEPLSEVGYADVLDESTSDLATVRLQVVSNEVTYADYAATIGGTPTEPTFTLAGYVTDGTVQADFSLGYAVVLTLATAEIRGDYSFDVEAADFHVDVAITFAGDNVEESFSATVNITITLGDDTIVVAGSMENETGSLNVTINDELFASIEAGVGTVTITAAGDSELTRQQRQTIERIFGVFEEILDTFDHFFIPVEWLFGI
jgi:hypothetical protein